MTTLKYMSVQNSSAVFIAPDKGASSSIPTRANAKSEITNTLFRITKEGNIERVVYYNENGEELQMTEKPSFTTPITGTPYIYVDFNYTWRYLVNTQTGAVYEWDKLRDAWGEYGSHPEPREHLLGVIALDKYGTVYWGYGWNICKFHTGDNDELVLKAITPREQQCHIWKFGMAVSNEGDVCYFSTVNQNELTAWRLVARNGRSTILAVCDKDYWSGRPDLYVHEGLFPFRGLDGNIHALTYDHLLRFNVADNGGVSFDTITTRPAKIEAEMSYLITMDGAEQFRFATIQLPDKILSLDKHSRCLILDSKNPDELLQNYLINEGKTVTASDVLGNKLYCVCNSSAPYEIITTNLNDFSSTLFFQTEDYTISSINAQQDGSVIFSGIRLADNMNVIASIDINGEVTVLSEQPNQDEPANVERISE